MRRIALLLSICLLAPAAAAKKAQKADAPAPIVVDFESGETGKPADGWGDSGTNGTGTDGYHGSISDVSPHGGKRALMFESFGAPDWGAFAYRPDPASYRGRVVRFSAWLRYEGEGSTGLWFRVDRPNGGRGFFANTQDKPMTSATWTKVELVGEIDADADKVIFGALISGKGKAWIDDVTIEVLAAPPPEGPRPLAGRALDNVVAFARLLGYVRHFHPSDQAAAVDWNAFAIDGVRAVEKAKDAKALAQALDKLFAPVAPSLRIFVTGKPPAAAAPPKGATRVTWWEHHGFGQGASGPHAAYESNQKWADLKDGALPESVPASEPLLVEIAGGVSARLPIVVYADAKGTLPAMKPAKAAEARYTRSSDRATRLASVALAWNVFEHFYPYFDVVQVDWMAALPETLAAAADAPDDRAYFDALARMVAKLHDGHGGMSGTGQRPYTSLPLSWDVIEGKLVVTAVAGDVGVNPGDVVVSIDGRDALDALEAEKQLHSAATPQWLRYRARTSLGRGEAGTQVALEIERAGARSKVALTRSDKVPDLDEPRPEPVAEIKSGIMYVDLTRINDAQWKEALPRLAKAKGILLDMRGYPSNMRPQFLGHLTDKAVDSAQWHVPIVTKPDHVDLRFDDAHWSIDPAQPRLKAKVAFLTGGLAISYAETVMGIVEHYKLGLIVGEATAGTNGNVNPFSVPSGHILYWTGMQVLKHDGSQHHGVGIQPTHPVARTIAGIAAGKDEVLQAACRLVEK